MTEAHHDASRTLRDTLRPRQTFRVLIEVLGVAGLAVLVYFAAPLDGDRSNLLAALLVIAAIGALIPVSVHGAHQVLVSEHPLLTAVRSLAIALTLLIVSFSTIYFVLGSAHDDQIDGLRTKIDGLYFTVTILTTVGFGDITATGQGARALVTANMVVNLVFLAVAIRAVSWALRQRGDHAAIHPRAPRSASD